MGIEVHEASAERWGDIEALFSASPATRSCWCVWPRVAPGAMWGRSEVENRASLRADVAAGQGLGVLAYVDGRVAGWCSVGPASAFGRFDGSPDEAWAVTCLFISRSFRGAGVGKALIEAAVDMAARRGAQSLVGVPRGWRPEGGSEGVPDVVSRFVQAGFAVTEEGAPFLVRRGLAL